MNNYLTEHSDKLRELSHPQNCFDKKEHYRMINKCDDDFNKLVSCVNELVDAACRHDLHVMNEWVNKWSTDDNKVDWHKIIKK